MHGKYVIKLTAVILTALALLAAAPQAHATGGEPIGNFRTEKKETASNETDILSSEAETLISLSNGVLYSPENDLFYYDVDGNTFGINVPNGAVVTEAVSISLSPPLNSVLYKNGTEVKGDDMTCITAPGKYILAVTANDAGNTVRVGFTILSSPTGKIKEYVMPADFFVVSATLNGEPTSFSQTRVDMTTDGYYVIDYRSPEADKDFQLCVTIDHTPPTVTLSGVVDGKSNQPVTVSDIEDGARIYLVKNKNPVSYTGAISETGSYTLTVQDEAGNESIYDFVVVTYASNSMKLLIVTTLILILAIVGSLIYYRKYMRVS